MRHKGEIDVARVRTELESFLAGFDRILDTYRRWLDTPWTTEHAEQIAPDFEQFGRRHLAQIPALANPASVPNLFRAFNNFTAHGTHMMKSANSAFRFLDATNSAFGRLTPA